MRGFNGNLRITIACSAVFIVLVAWFGCITQESAGSERYLFFKQDYASINNPPVILQAGTAGSSTIFANATSARTAVVSFGSWWNTGYSHRQQITITNNNLTTSIPTKFTASITLNTQQLVSAGRLRQDGNDFRVVWWNVTSSTWLEIDRANMTNFNNPSTTVRFGTQRSIPAGGTDNNYYVYYGNSTAPAPPSDGRNVYLFEDQFNRASNSTVGFGWLEYETGGSDVRVAPNPLVSTNVLDLYSVNNPMDTIATHMLPGLSSTGKCVWEFGFVWDRDMAENNYEVYMQIGNGSMTTSSPWLGVGPFLSWTGTAAATTGRPATAHEMLRVFDDDQTPTEVEVLSGGANLTVEVDFSHSNFALFRNGVAKGTYHFYQGLTTYDRIRFVSDQITPTNIVKRGFDYTRVYFRMSPDPSVSVGGVESLRANYDYVLRTSNVVANSRQIRLKKYSDSNINRLRECTIYLHNSTGGNFTQIRVQNGVYTQDAGQWCTLPPSSASFIAMTVQTNSTSFSRIYAYLDVRVPNTTTYIRLIVEFDIS